MCIRDRYMHWWKFLILFEGLPEQAEIKQRMMSVSYTHLDVYKRQGRIRELSIMSLGMKDRYVRQRLRISEKWLDSARKRESSWK